MRMQSCRRGTELTVILPVVAVPNDEEGVSIARNAYTKG